MPNIKINRFGRPPAFTLIELLVVIAIIAILAALLLPAMAAAKRRAIVAECQSNFHQVYVASLIYANDYHDYFPIYGIVNSIGYPSQSSEMTSQNALSPNNPVRPSIQNGIFDSLGHLYETQIISEGKIFFCPSYPDTSPFSAIQYSNPSFMSTDGDGLLRSSMMYNPEVVNPNGPLPSDTARLFPKTSSIIPNRLFGMDCLQIITKYGSISNAIIGPAFAPDTFPHYPSHGFDVLFTDGSIRFVQSVPAFNLVRFLTINNATYSPFFQMLENAP
jgi:prepilin-type N-terminal cleavage/methylation domain-containing protein